MDILDATPAAVRACGLMHKCALAADSNAPLLVLVHGRAGNRDVMWAFRRTFPFEMNVFAVQAPHPDPLGGFSWWLIDDPRWQVESERSCNALLRFVSSLSTVYHLAPRLRIGLGFSQGAGLLSLIAQREPTLFDGVGLLAGFVIEDHASPQPPLPRVIMAHGSSDQTVTIEKARNGATYLRNKGYDLIFVEDLVGHKVGTAGMKTLSQWLLSFR